MSLISSAPREANTPFASSRAQPVATAAIRANEKFPRGAGLASVHGHFPNKNSPSSFHITCLQGLKSFPEPYITRISIFYASILISCSEYRHILSINVI
jgi:hypothetical protein